MKKWTAVLFAALTFAADAISKAWALQNLQPGISLPFIPGILQLTLTTNTGGAFGIGREHKELMTLLSTAIALGISFLIYKKETGAQPPSMLERCGLGFVLGGALGNIFDRFARGRVTDFLEFAFISFPVFNVADALIDVGVGLIIIHSLLEKKASPSSDATGN